MIENPTLPKISVVTPSFNQGRFLEECIDSVLSQNYPNLEYIIMDGGSTDNSLHIIKKYEKHLTYWQSKPDGGQYAAINEGFKKTSGEIMAWLNSDDKYHQDAFFGVASIFHTHDKVEWINGRPSFWDENGEIIRIERFLHGHSRADFLKKKYSDPFIQQESTFWRRTLWDRAGGYVDGNYGYAGDLELWVRFFRHSELYPVNLLIGGYRTHGNQKALLEMDKYIAEAEKTIEDEIIYVSQEQSPRMKAAPDPLEVDHRKVAALMRSSGRASGNFMQVYLYLQKELVAQCDKVALQQQAIQQTEQDRCCSKASAPEGLFVAGKLWHKLKVLLKGLA